MRIFLIGFMCSGKSTIGRLLAHRLGLSWIDTDILVEGMTGRSIPDIFSEDGEEAFRRLESYALGEAVLRTPRGVISTGGGIVLKESNLGLMRREGTTVYLSILPEDVLLRAGDMASRPLLLGPDALGRVRELMTAREHLYRAAADIVIPGSGGSPEETVSMIIDNIPGMGVASI